MVIEPYLEGRVPDILMVPFSISYERTLEELLLMATCSWGILGYWKF